MQDIRSLNQTRVQLEYNAGFQGAMAGLVEAPGSWEVCLQVRAPLSFPVASCRITHGIGKQICVHAHRDTLSATSH